MKTENNFVDVKFVYLLSIPGAIIYVAYLSATSNSLLLALIGYVTLGICFGSLISLFKLKNPYRVALLSSSLIPVIAYFFVLFLGFLYRNDLTKVSIDVSGEIIQLNPFVYQNQLGKLFGMAVFILVIFGFLSITFGILGLCGMFIGKGVSQSVNQISNKDKKNKMENKAVQIEKLKTLAVIATSLISGTISLITAIVK
jgi:hypothetical protein